MSRRTPQIIRRANWLFYVVTTATTIDEDTDDPVTTTSEVAARGIWAPAASGETGDRFTAELTLYATNCAERLDAGTQVRIPSGYYAGTWELIGPGKQWDNGTTAFVEALLRRVT